jgi:hypothetical protein
MAAGSQARAGSAECCRLAASLADQASVSLGEAITGIDDRNVALLVKAILHASGGAGNNRAVSTATASSFLNAGTAGGWSAPVVAVAETGPGSQLLRRCHMPAHTEELCA